MTQQQQIEHLEKMAHTHLESMLRASRELRSVQQANGTRSQIIRAIGDDLASCLVQAARVRFGA